MNTETMIRELIAVAEKHKNDFVPTFQTNISAMCRDIIPKLEQLAEYEAIGTVEECRESRKRQQAQRPNVKIQKDDFKIAFGESAKTYRCSACGAPITETDRYCRITKSDRYCRYCGQAIDWSNI